MASRRITDMASKDVTVKQWECESCGTTVLADAGSKELPAGWTILTIELNNGVGGSTKGIEVCQECSKNPELAKRKAKARWGQ
jgi:hypothetical protein